MESSEDDAGAATNASRRASAREKDIGESEEGSACGGMLQEPPEPRTVGEGCSTAEEAFDADSVPSPSAQDVNTSTEALLDMIDEIVDGPSAPKRRSHAEADDDAENGADGASSTPDLQSLSGTMRTTISLTSSPVSSDTSDKLLQGSASVITTKSTSHGIVTDNVYIKQVSLESDNHAKSIFERQTDEINVEEMPQVIPDATQSECNLRNMCKETLRPMDQDQPLEFSTCEPNNKNTEKECKDSVIATLPDNVEKSASESVPGNIPIISIEPLSDNIQESKTCASPDNIQEAQCNVLPLKAPATPIEASLDNYQGSCSEPCNIQDSGSNTVPDNIFESSSKTVLHRIQESGNETLSANIQERSSETVSDNIQENNSKTVSDNIQESGSESLSDNIQESSSKTVSDNIQESGSETVLDNIQESNSETVSDNIQACASNTLQNYSQESSTKTVLDNSQETACEVLPRESDKIRESDNDVLPDRNPKTASAAPPDKSPECGSEVLAQCSKPTSHEPDSPQSSQASCSEPQKKTVVESMEVSKSIASVVGSNIPLNIPSSSVTQTVQIVSDSNEHQTCGRTIKCVTSSDKKDNVTIESAESTSSDYSVSDGRSLSGEVSTRSPLRRRLVRPAPSERRPDSTVSSTVDSQQVNIRSTGQTTSESVAKDVSSSSDAIASVYDNIKPAEIRNLSEISICKAETSVNPSKKIKLVRQKITPSTTLRDVTPQKQTVALESEQCQSTSAEFIPSAATDSQFTYNTLPSATSGSVSSNIEPASDTAGSVLCNDLVMQSPMNATAERSEQQSEELPQPIILPLQEDMTYEALNSAKDNQHKVPSIKLNINKPEPSEVKLGSQEMHGAGSSSNMDIQETSEPSKQVPKLTIKLGNKQAEEIKSPIPKLTIKQIRPPSENEGQSKELREQIPSITKINIKPIPRPADKIIDTHRKSSSSDISESESSENDESNSTSDQTSNSDQGSSDIVPKVTIKVGKVGTESEGKFYTEQNVPKLLIKGIHPNENEVLESTSKLKLVISQSEEKQHEKIPKLTIKTVSKSEGQPVSPKLSIKSMKPPDNIKKEMASDSTETQQVPKITIKPVLKTDAESSTKTFRKSSTAVCDSSDHIPVVTKINIKPILKPNDCEELDNLECRVPVVSKLHIKPIVKPTNVGEPSKEFDCPVPVVSKLNIKPILRPTEIGEGTETFEDVPVVSRINIKPIVKPKASGETSEVIEAKVPVVSKLNIKPLVKPKENKIESSIDDIPKVTKINIKPLRNVKVEEEKDCDELNTDAEDNSIPVVTKLNIKPIVKPVEEDTSKDSENQSSETGNSSDDNADIPVVTKINIKPILKPSENEIDSAKPNSSHEDSMPVVTKLNIKPLIKPEECRSPSSPKKDSLKIMKLNIKPILKPEELEQQIPRNESEEICIKNPPLLMKINIKNVAEVTTNENSSCDDEDKKINNIGDAKEHMINNVEENIPKISKLNIKPIIKPAETDIVQGGSSDDPQPLTNCKSGSIHSLQTRREEEAKKVNCVPVQDISHCKHGEESKPCNAKSGTTLKPPKHSPLLNTSADNTRVATSFEACTGAITETHIHQTPSKPKSSLQNCTLLKKLLETKKDGLDKRLEKSEVNHSSPARIEVLVSDEVSTYEQCKKGKGNSEACEEALIQELKFGQANVNHPENKYICVENMCSIPGENITKPLEISISDKISNQSSGQDSPRIILKINKTDHGSSAKIITEELKRPDSPHNDVSDNTQDTVNDKQNLKKIVNSRRKQVDTPNVTIGKRLRSSRIVENTEISPIKRNIGKRLPATDTSSVETKELELSVLESKRLKLGQLLSNKSLLNTPTPPKVVQAPTRTNVEVRQTGKIVNHSILNNENCSKNGNSKLHNILSNLQAKQAQALAFKELKSSEIIPVTREVDSNPSTNSSDVTEVTPVENSRPEVQEMLIIESSESRDLPLASDDISQDPLEVDTVNKNKPITESPPVSEFPPIIEIPSVSESPCVSESPSVSESRSVSESPTVAKSPTMVPPPIEMTPQPKKRGRPRKLPASEPAKPVVLPVPALEERPQRSLRLSRDQSRQPAILSKPRGRGRGRGRRADPEPRPPPPVDVANRFYEDQHTEEIDPTSSRVKLPRMTEALDNMPSTPLTSRRTSESFGFDSEPKVVLSMLPSMECPAEAPRGGRGRRGRGRAPGRSPRAARGGRGRGGGRGAQYMKETMGIYGRVCGPATTTVQLFEEETCMMDDNATPAKPAHLLDEDSQSSVKSSTNDSSKMKKSKFAELFDSNKVWTAADVKEYTWPPPETTDVEHQVMMIQEQVSMFLGVKSFKRRYPELKRRTISAEERDYVLGKGLVTEALCDLGITAVDASEVLDIMLSDYPHKYEEYRSHQRQRQLAEAVEEAEVKPEPVPERVEMKPEAKPAEVKPEPPKVDLEKTRLEAMAAAIASAGEWNARLNASRAAACVDLQSHVVQRRRPPRAAPPPPRARPPAGFYPHALLPGQFQHHYRAYSAHQLRYLPLNTVMSAPPPASPPASESDSAPDWRSDSSSDASASDRPKAKRKKLTKRKRSSQGEPAKEEREEDTCRECGLRLEANRKYTHERFLVCATCNAKLHPGCVDLSADTVRAARGYAWQCGACKACAACCQTGPPPALRCALCDRAYHPPCQALPAAPPGRWHCPQCAICRSCGARSPGGGGGGAEAGGAEEARWHHQTRRGPGGHKVYSHSLCTPCARAYRIGRYCPLCERSFIGPKGTMQIVICKLCDRQHHQECVKQTVQQLKVLDYTCGGCRRGGITSRAAAVRLAPRTIATLFMAKRRFNKYAHRQYMKSRLQQKSDSNETEEAAEEPRREDASEGSEGAEPEVSDPLEGAGDEAAAAVAALRMDFGD